ncbi:MAG: glycosyltransferase family 2 protein [Clostridia bacterium]|nr:glycosyltransferase family 2 protein [Clostridia bacterium]
MKITIAIVAYNEEAYLPKLFEDIKNQTYPHEKIELLFINSMSEDGTKALMEQFAKENSDEFLSVRVLENKQKRQSNGWNIAIQEFSTESLVMISAHGHIPESFIAESIKILESGENICGGMRPAIIENESAWSQTLLLAEESLFGSSPSSARRNNAKSYVKSIFHAAYKREVFEKVGLYRDDLGRTEDNEFLYRVRQAGFKICMAPEIISYQYIRPTLTKMCKQKYGNGYWIGRTLAICPQCFSLYHFVPFAFVCGILITAILALFKMPLLAAIMWAMYAVAAFCMTALAIAGAKNKSPFVLLLPFIFLLLHICYGVGTLVGILQIPFAK